MASKVDREGNGLLRECLALQIAITSR